VPRLRRFNEHRSSKRVERIAHTSATSLHLMKERATFDMREQMVIACFEHTGSILSFSVIGLPRKALSPDKGEMAASS
jgi:hypothetical protein